MSDRVPAHLTDIQVDTITRYNDCNVDGGLAALLAREVQASRKLIADLRALHEPWTTNPPEWSSNPCCACRTAWPVIRDVLYGPARTNRDGVNKWHA